MTTQTVTTPIPMVGMGQIQFIEPNELAKAVLGSCIGLALFHPRLRIGCLAHIVLPAAENREGPPGKFADTAVPEMLQWMQKKGANRTGIVAKLAGGSNMFNSAGPLQIGNQNTAAVLAELDKISVRIAGKHVGGTKGRRVLLTCQTGELTVEIAGETPVVL